MTHSGGGVTSSWTERVLSTSAQIMRNRLEGGDAQSQTAADMAALQSEIEAHVSDAETEFFPVARGADIDLHVLGRISAARRVAGLRRRHGRHAAAASVASLTQLRSQGCACRSRWSERSR
jgi:hypothetical protein